MSIMNGFPSGGGARIDVDVAVAERRIRDYPLMRSRRDPLVLADSNGDIVIIGGLTLNNALSPEATASPFYRTVERRFADGGSDIAGVVEADIYVGAIDGSGNFLLYYGASASSVHRYSKIWEKLPSTSIGSGIIDPAVATDWEGKVWFAGGYNYSGGTYVSTINIIDSDGVKTTNNLSAQLAYVAGGRDGEGNVWFGGGRLSNGIAQATVNKFSAPTGTRTVYALSQARSECQVATNGEGNVLFLGGLGFVKVVEMFTPSGIRTTLEPLVAGGSSMATSTDGDGGVVCVSGVAGLIATSTVDYYDRYGAHSVLPALFVPRGFNSRIPSAAMNRNGEVVIAGGTLHYQVSSGLTATGSADVDKYTAQTKKSIRIPAQNAYKFIEHSTEQGPSATDQQVVVNTPNIGYFKPARGKINI